MRDNYLQFPSAKEIKQILSTEADRDIPSENMNKNFVDFSSLIHLMESYNVSADFIEFNRRFSQEINLEELDKVADIFNQLLENILQKSPNSAQLEILTTLYDYLSEEDIPEEADIIFVFGSKERFRTEKAIQLYKDGLASKLMFSGNKPIYKKNSDAPEIYTHIEQAKEEGISENNIIIEDKSISIPDNVKRSLNLLEENNIPHSKIILVMSPFAQRRGYAHFQKFSSGIKFCRVNSRSSDKYLSENWFKDKIAVRVVLNEWAKMWFAEKINTI